MQNKTTLLEQLSQLLSRKQSKEYYAHRLGITVGQVEDLLNEIRMVDFEDNITSQESIKLESSSSKRFNPGKGEIEVNAYWDHEPSPEEVAESHNIDINLWKLAQYWSKQKNKGWQVSALFSEKRLDKDYEKTEFVEFLKNYKPVSPIIKKQSLKNVYNSNTGDTCLIINKQDAHLNKYDEGGDNNIKDRFNAIESKVQKILNKATCNSNLTNIVYVIGSDEFNSESNNMTTHGTPQKNIMNYHEGFQAICDHEITIINLLLHNADSINVLYIPGNHDEVVGWHLINWLSAFYRNNDRLIIDSSTSYTKYVKFDNTAMCFNHGYSVKPEVLVQNFPVEFKQYWSECDNYYIFIGDKHTELARQLGGINIYRLSTLSKAKSKWDNEKGYTISKGELSAFLVESGNGLTDIYKEVL